MAGEFGWCVFKPAPPGFPKPWISSCTQQDVTTGQTIGPMYKTKAQAEQALATLGGNPGTGPPPASPDCGKPSHGWTFGQWRKWANCKSPGAGDQFWSWVQANAPASPLAPPKLSDHSYGDASITAILQGHDNSAAGWFGAWLLLGNVAPDIAALLAAGIGKGGQLAITAAGGAVAGLSPFQGGILGFLGNLENASTWIRVGEVLLGIVLIAIGVARITDAVPIATKIARTVK